MVASRSNKGWPSLTVSLGLTRIRSITPSSHIVCLECGDHQKMLNRHLLTGHSTALKGRTHDRSRCFRQAETPCVQGAVHTLWQVLDGLGARARLSWTQGGKAPRHCPNGRRGEAFS
ncbi:MucR family transcriptional regulator [Magnetospirillum moscoviense]|uniref:MucR family transcriptional regulator n=1 Tax=Magnetospirillum moscoviense TaxID=1437059 RepID=UPI00316AD1B2